MRTMQQQLRFLDDPVGADAGFNDRVARRLDELEAEIKRLQSPAMEEYRRHYEKDFPDG